MTTAKTRRRLNRERILKAAVRFADHHGLERLSMRRVGAALGVEAMALYRHVRNKASLLDGIVETVIGEIELPRSSSGDWEEGLKQIARAVRRTAHRHPHIYPLIVVRPLNTPGSLQPIEVVFALLHRAGFDDRAALAAWRTYAGYVDGYILNEIGGSLPLAGGRSLRLDLRRLPPDEFPRITRLVAHKDTLDPDNAFEFGLDAIVAGLKHQLGRR